MHPHDRPLLDTVRWISAGLVALGHAIGLIVAPVALGEAPPLAVALRIVGDFRGGCVILFFVLSGYLVGGGVLMRRQRFEWRSYAIARFSRIYVVLIPAIFLIIALDHLAGAIAPDSPVYTTIWAPGALGQRTVMSAYRLIDYVGTFLGLASIVGTPLGSGGPLWSLGHEWLFYFIFPAIVVPLRRFRGWWPTAGGVGVAIIVATLIHRTPTAAFFLIWSMGAAARVALSERLIPRSLAVAGLALAIGAFLASSVNGSRIVELVLGAGFALFLAHHAPGERGISRQFDNRLATASYSLYVCHLTVMAFVTMLLNRTGLLPPQGLIPATAGDLVHVVGLLAAVLLPAVVVAWCFARAFEGRTEAFRRLLARGLSARPITA